METLASAALWLQEPVNLLVALTLVVALLWLGVRVARRRRVNYTLKLRDPRKAHRWHSAEFIDKPTYCNACMQMCVSGSSCESCGLCICSESQCIRMASNTQGCKPFAMAAATPCTPHFWIKGNLPLYSLCFKCLAPCGNLPRLVDYRCVWCHQTAHEGCVEEMDSECSLGPHQSCVIPPNCVTLRLEGWRGRRRLVVKEIHPPTTEGWTPLIVLANPKSGGKDGQMVLSAVRKLLNPIQVIDLSEMPPESGLEICRLLPDHDCRVLVCGGDGTVGWVLGALDKCKLPRLPQVGILPLGTGNDLARVLGWGTGYDGEDISEMLTNVEHAQLSMLDRWEVKIEQRRYLGMKRREKVLVMNNYLGLGCDAAVTLNFHRQRESRPELFPNRIINKAWYLGFGAKDVLEQSGKNLRGKMELYLDGALQQLPDLEGVVLLNINSWSAGCTMWSDGSSCGDQFRPSRMDDHLLEVAGLYSSIHVGRIQVSLAEPVRLGQAREVKIVIHDGVPIQVDGEPWQQGAATITVSHQGQAHMLRKLQHTV